MAEGEYPRDFRPDWLLREEDRHYINQQGYNLDTIDILLRRERESFGFLTSCSDVGYFSYPLTEEGGSPHLMSTYLEELMAKAEKVLKFQGDFASAYRAKKTDQGKGYSSGVWDIDDIPEAGRNCLDKPFSASSINSYGQCPFKFFLERALNLAKDPEEGEYTKMARGNVMHRVLQGFYSQRLGEGLRKEDMAQYAEEITASMEEHLGAEYRKSFEHQRLYEMERDELVETLVKYIEYNVKTQGDYTPWKLEYPFGFEEPFTLKGLPDVKLRGVIDRVDISPEGDMVIFDYKNSGTPPVEEVYQGISMQLPLYILAAEALLGKSVKGGAYISLKKATAGSVLVKDKALPFAKRKRTGIFTEEEWEEFKAKVVNILRSQVDRISRGEFPPEPKKCPKIDEYGAFCDFTEVCPWEVEEK